MGGGQLTFDAQNVDEKIQMCDIPNLLIQKWPALEFQITTCLHLAGLEEGDAAGMVSQCGHYTGLFAVKRNGKLTLQQRTGNWTKDNEVRTDLGEVQQDTLYIRMKVKDSTQVSFEVGYDEETYQPIGETVEAAPGRWVGVKAGLAAINETGEAGGSVAVDYFVFEQLN